MSPEVVGIIGVIMILVLLAFRMYIGSAMGLIGLIGIILLRGITPANSIAGFIPFQNISAYSMTVIPMFAFMGVIISETEIGTDLFQTANKWIGHVRGGLASASIVACGLLGAIIGSSTISTIVMGKIALPEMRKNGYDDLLSTGTIAAGSPLAIIIPPSMPFVLYGILTEQSIGKLFISGVLPGVLMMIAYVAVIAVMCRVKPKLAPAEVQSFSLKEKLLSLKSTWAMLALVVLVLGGIYGGFFTPTESGAIGALGALIIGMVKRKINLKVFMRCVKQAAYLSGMILYLLAGTFIFNSFITMSNLPELITSFVTGLAVPVFVVLLAIGVMYLILGCFLPEYPMMVLTVPLLFPAIMNLGVDPIWFGLFVVLLMALGSISPPIGLTVFILGGITGVSVNKIFRGVMPFLVVTIVIIVLIVIFPSLATFLPSLM